MNLVDSQGICGIGRKGQIVGEEVVEGGAIGYINTRTVERGLEN